MSALRLPPPPIERLHGGTPILQAIATHPWENRVTFNPACACIADPAKLQAIAATLPIDDATRRRIAGLPAVVALLYRAQGTPTTQYDYSRSSMGLAILTPELELLARLPDPVIVPDQEFENLGVEDGRITPWEGEHVLCYTGYSSSSEGNRVRIAFATTTDFSHWKKLGLLIGDPNLVDNKNAMLFEERVNGKLTILHRPMTGRDAMAIHWAQSNSLLSTWKTNGLLMSPLPNPEFTDTWIGGGSPPLRLDDSLFLMPYHIGNRRANGTREYDLGLALADFSHPDIIVKRSEPLLRPEIPAELAGDPLLGVSNVAFLCGSYFHNGDLYFPYAGADSVVLGAKISGTDLRAWIG